MDNLDRLNNMFVLVIKLTLVLLEFFGGNMPKRITAPALRPDDITLAEQSRILGGVLREVWMLIVETHNH